MVEPVAPTVEPRLNGLHEDEARRFPGCRVWLRSTAPHTGNALSLIEQIVPPGVGSPDHISYPSCSASPPRSFHLRRPTDRPPHLRDGHATEPSVQRRTPATPAPYRGDIDLGTATSVAPVPIARTEHHTEEHHMSATVTVPSPTLVPTPPRLTILLMPASPGSAIDPALAGDPRALVPAGPAGWPEGEPTWEDAEWQ